MITIDATASPQDIARWMLDAIGASLNVPGDRLDPSVPFTSYGLDSIAAFALTLDLAEWLERDLPASLFWEFTTVDQLAQHLSDILREDRSALS